MEILYSTKLIREFIDDRMAILFTDSHINNLYPDFLKGIERMVLPVGERAKTLETYKDSIEFLLDRGIRRSDLLISFGGGTISDITGFVASTYMRGIDFLSVPTTLLAMVDASIGGKCGINLSQGKNLLGSFYNPQRIFIEPMLLETLPTEEYNNGMAEIIKIALINDKNLVELILNNASIEKIIKSAIKNKMEIVERDYQDKGIRHLLNYGHTLAHAIEARSNYRERHGQSVAKGMYFITNWAVMRDKSEREVLEVLRELLSKYNIEYNFNPQGLWEYILSDKKIEGEYIREVYPVKIGKGIIEEIALTDYKKILEV